MNSFSKLFALAFLAAGTTLVSSAAAGAQAGGVPNPIPFPAQPACCTPAQQPVTTSAAWTVTPPNGVTQQAVPLSSTPYYATPAPAHWIAHNAHAGTYTAPVPAPGKYVYTYHFCLCGLPKMPLPAAMQLSILSDNSFKAYLNGSSHLIGQNPSSYAFQSPTVIAGVPASYFVVGDNVLTVEVKNDSGPTGLAVWGTITGFFQQGAACRHIVDPTGRTE